MSCAFRSCFHPHQYVFTWRKELVTLNKRCLLCFCTLNFLIREMFDFSKDTDNNVFIEQPFGKKSNPFSWFAVNMKISSSHLIWAEHCFEWMFLKIFRKSIRLILFNSKNLLFIPSIKNRITHWAVKRVRSCASKLLNIWCCEWCYKTITPGT